MFFEKKHHFTAKTAKIGHSERSDESINKYTSFRANAKNLPGISMLFLNKLKLAPLGAKCL